MADEVGRHARQVVGQIVLEIRHHSPLLGQGGGTCLNVPFLYPVLYPLLYPSFLSDNQRVGGKNVRNDYQRGRASRTPSGSRQTTITSISSWRSSGTSV